MMNNDFSVTIIDDDPVVHYVVSTLFKREIPSITTHVFLNALDFLEAVERGFVTDLVFLDLNMPRMDGWQLLDELKKREVKFKVYIFSSSSDARDLRRVNEYPMVSGYIVKPLTIERLQGLIATLSAT